MIDYFIWSGFKNKFDLKRLYIKTMSIFPSYKFTNEERRFFKYASMLVEIQMKRVSK